MAGKYKLVQEGDIVFIDSEAVNTTMAIITEFLTNPCPN